MTHIPSDVWMEYPLGYFLCEVIDYRGKTPPGSDSGIPVISAAHVKNGKVVHDGKKYVSQDVYDRWTTRGFVKPGDVLITTEAPVAQVAQLPGDQTYLITRRVIALQVDPTKGDERFIKYCLMTDKVRKGLEALGHGTTVPRLYKEDILGFRLQVPSLPTQRKIAAILSAYDDLIENNTRRIAILEEMAQLLYREWFVRLRFPGHESVPMVDSELGSIPEGWEVCRVTDAVCVNPRMKMPKEGEKPYLPMRSLSETSMLIGDVEHRTGNSGSKFKNGDTLFARITPCLENGKTGFVQFLESDAMIALGSTEFIVLRSKTLSPEYVYLLARSDRFRDHAIKSMTGATGRQRVQVVCFDQFFIAHPDREILERFVAQVRPLFCSIHVLAEKNAVLRRTRDLLLPRLISGQLDVSDLDIDTGGLNEA